MYTVNMLVSIKYTITGFCVLLNKILISLRITLENVCIPKGKPKLLYTWIYTRFLRFYVVDSQFFSSSKSNVGKPVEKPKKTYLL